MHEILALYEAGVTVEVKGGYDTGCWFSFIGKLTDTSKVKDRHVGGRLVRPTGFCSEGMVCSKPAPSQRDIEAFFKRVGDRETQLRRWIDEFNALKAQGECE
jgi:hypothetical protein